MSDEDSSFTLVKSKRGKRRGKHVTKSFRGFPSTTVNVSASEKALKVKPHASAVAESKSDFQEKEGLVVKGKADFSDFKSRLQSKDETLLVKPTGERVNRTYKTNKTKTVTLQPNINSRPTC